MADPYQPLHPGIYEQPRAVSESTYGKPSRPTPAADPPRSGFITGLLVALVFVVVAILAAAILRPDMPDIEATVPATTIAPDAAPVNESTATTGDATAQPQTGAAPVDPLVESGTAGPEADPATPPASGMANP